MMQSTSTPPNPLSPLQCSPRSFTQFMPESYYQLENLSTAYRSRHSYALSPMEHTFLSKFLQETALQQKDLSTWCQVDEINNLTSAIPVLDGLRESLEHSLKSQGFYLLQNLPLDQADGNIKSGNYSETNLMLLGKMLGVPYGYRSQRFGKIIQDLQPVLADQNKQLGSNSVDLLWHSEDAHFYRNCDYILLSCIRGAQDAQTLLSFINPRELNPNTLRELQKPQYSISADDSFVNGNNPTNEFPIILSGPDGRIRFDPLYTHCQSEQAYEALLELNHYLNSSPISICLQAGDLLVIDNRWSVHARTQYTPNYDGNDRWLQRMNVFSSELPNADLWDVERRVINL